MSALATKDVFKLFYSRIFFYKFIYCSNDSEGVKADEQTQYK